MARQVLERRRAETRNLVEQLMIQFAADAHQHRIDLAEIAHPPLLRIGLAGEGHFGIETVPMHAPVRSRRRVFQIMRGVEAELLRDLDFGLMHGGGP